MDMSRAAPILIVDDDRLIRELCQEILVTEGHQVFTAADADEGVALLKAHAPGAILLDLMMPHLSGLEALNIFGELAPDAPVVVITAYPTQARVIEVLKRGAYDFLAKPFQPRDLIQAIGRALDRHRLLAENRRLVHALEEKVDELSRLYAVTDGFARQLEDRVRDQTIELSRSNQLLENVLANMGSGLLVVDTDGRIRLINPTGAETLGLNREEAMGRRLLDLFAEAADLQTALPDNRYREITLRRPDGPTIPLGFNTSALQGPEGPEGVIVVFRDLTEIKALQGEVRRKDRLAAIGEVASGVAHEIRNPLFGISSVAQILSRELQLGQSHRELLEALLRETRRLNTLVEDLLLYGRPSRLERTAVDLRGLWTDLLQLHQEESRAAGVALTLDGDAETPPASADLTKIRQVLLNLLKNALEATPSGGTITIRVRPGTDGTVETAIEDTGPGIPREQRTRIFELFFTTKRSGSGLGLAICRRLIEDHGGRIVVGDRPGGGTIFTVRLPAASG